MNDGGLHAPRDRFLLFENAYVEGGLSAMWIYKLLGGIAILVFIALFAAGIVIDSSPFRAQLTSGAFHLGAFIAVVLTYTPTNTALLALVAGYIAGCASRITTERVTVPPSPPSDATPEAVQKMVTLSTLYRIENPVASMFRSLIVFLAFMAGILVTTVDQFTATTQDQYIRLAAAVSFFSFVVGYDPTRLTSLLSGVAMPLKSPKP